MDILFLRDFRLEIIIGLYEWERKAPQPVLIDLEIGLYDHKAGHSGDIHDTVHYGMVVERFAAELAERRFGLLEALAEHLAEIVTGEFKAPWVRISVAKLGHIRNVRKVGDGQLRFIGAASMLGGVFLLLMLN